jgi:phosphoglycolate phosphatase
VKLVMWDIDWTLLYAGGVAQLACQAAVQALTGAEPSLDISFAGRTDLEAMGHVLARHGYTEPDLTIFFERYAAEFATRTHLLAERGYVLPGARQALAALSGRPDLVQTTVTGNIAPVAQAKLTAFDLAGALDLTVGGYGHEHAVRATLVASARHRAAVRYGEVSELVVVGDTRHDIAAALACGATAVGVATGGTSADELRAAGAHHVLDSLADTVATVALLAP